MKTIVWFRKWFGSAHPALLGRVSLVLLAALLAGCEDQKPSPATDKIILRGANTIGEELAPRLIAEYKKEHPTVTFDLEFKGTTYGVGALLGGRCDIAAASLPREHE